MKYSIIILLLIAFNLPIFGQKSSPVFSFSVQETFNNIPQDLRPGVFKDGEHIFISEESKRLFSDASYRDSIFPDQYLFDHIPQILEQGKTQLALYYLINLFEKNPVFSLKIIQDFNRENISGEDYLNAFYTYVYGDPDITDFSSGNLEIIYPEVMEHKMKIANYIALASTKLQEYATY